MKFSIDLPTFAYGWTVERALQRRLTETATMLRHVIRQLLWIELAAAHVKSAFVECGVWKHRTIPLTEQPQRALHHSPPIMSATSSAMKAHGVIIP